MARERSGFALESWLHKECNKILTGLTFLGNWAKISNVVFSDFLNGKRKK